MKEHQETEEEALKCADESVIIRVRANRDDTESRSCDRIQVKEIISLRWQKARIQILKLLDDDTTTEEKHRIADDLMGLMEVMSNGVTLKIEHSEGVDYGITWSLKGASENAPSSRLGRLPLADVNHKLFTLSDTITSVKNKMLMGRRDRQRDRINSVVDVHVCREIHRNFRRILQKESRFLRDELFSAKERIFRMERKHVANSHPAVDAASKLDKNENLVEPVYNYQHNAKLIPYHDLAYHPVNFINIVDPAMAPAHLWNPMTYAAASYAAAAAVTSANPAERLYYHYDFLRPLTAGYESLAAVANFNDVVPAAPPPPSIGFACIDDNSRRDRGIEQCTPCLQFAPVQFPSNDGFREENDDKSL